MVNAHLDSLELELRKLEGVRTVGFTSQHDVLYIQLFIEADAPASTLPFEATRIAQRHSSSPVAVELVRWTNLASPQSNQGGLSSLFTDMEEAHNQGSSDFGYEAMSSQRAGSIGTLASPHIPAVGEEGYDDSRDVREEPHDYIDVSTEENGDFEDEVDLAAVENREAEILDPFPKSDFDNALNNERRGDTSLERIALLLVTTSGENDEIEVHLSFDELRTIGRAATNRGLLGAIDATVEAIAEVTGSNDFHAEWARSLEPGAEHASLVAVGLSNSEGTDTRHGIAGGATPIEAAARATLNALNRVAVLAASQQ
ncbi:MAG TPA: hypothetical protein PKB15_04650 [Acidimicrobiia bacterium]|nr:hypothetical protein [Acidimicrobiia bacterium]